MSLFFTTHTSASAFLQATRSHLPAHQRKLNVILPHAEKLAAHQRAGGSSSSHTSGQQFWITAWSPPSGSNPIPSLEFILSCTEHHLGTYPLFLVYLRPLSTIQPAQLTSQMSLLAHHLANIVPPTRVFSFFGQEAPIRALSAHWTSTTGFKQVLDPYYEASSSYCTKQTLVKRSIDSSLLPPGHEMRVARAEDTHAIAQLCQEFAEDSVRLIKTCVAALFTDLVHYSHLSLSHPPEPCRKLST